MASNHASRYLCLITKLKTKVLASKVNYERHTLPTLKINKSLFTKKKPVLLTTNGIIKQVHHSFILFIFFSQILNTIILKFR